MEFHVGSLADLINQKTRGKITGTTLFQNIPSSLGKEVQFKVIPSAKKRISYQDEATNSLKHNVGDDTFHPSRFKRNQQNKIKQNNAVNAAKRVYSGKQNLTEKIVNPEEDRRTIFVGNLPCNIKVKKLKKMFKSYGEIESARLRCPPVKSPGIPKRVAVIKKQFHPDRTNIVGYIRFSSEEEATAALQANGLLYEGHHLRVDLSTRSGTHDQKKAVFVGNVHFGAEENDLWEVFQHCGEIESIRVIRDSQTGVGKGFAYVNFKDLSSMELALKLDGEELKERPIRVNRAVKKVKVKKGLTSPKVGGKGPGHKFKGFVNGKGKKDLREDNKETEESARSSFPRGGKMAREDGEVRIAGKKRHGDDSDEIGERSEGAKRAKKEPKLKFKPKVEKSRLKRVARTSEDEPSFLGNKMDGKAKGKVKKMKLSKSDLKKQVLAFQLALKNNGTDDK